MRNYKKYTIWQEAHIIALNTYKLSKKLPESELYGIVSQMRRAAVSVPANIAEGCGRNTDKEFKRFLIIARGSITELQYFFILTKDLKILPEEDCSEMIENCDKLMRSISSLIIKIKSE